MTEKKPIKDAIVPCNGCFECCKRGSIFILPEEGDDPEKYKTVQSFDRIAQKERLMLDHKPNGDCIYLGEAGCTIYDDRPVLCRAFDCRRQFLMLTKRMREVYIKAGFTTGREFEEGKKRQWSLTGEERRECIEIRNKRTQPRG